MAKTGKNDMKGGRVPHNRCDLANKRFGLLTALYPTGETRNRSRVWHCACACGSFTDATARNLNRGAVKSCGCLRHRPPDDSHSIVGNLHFVDGTCVENLIASQKRPVISRTGVRGVYYQRRSGDFVSYIGFKGRERYLGKYKTVAEAARARSAAEQELYEPFLRAYFRNGPPDAEKQHKAK
jgi:hypothetical protein